MATRGGYEEVVIDGDSSEEDAEVVVVTPRSRKRRRQSTTTIVDDEDEAPVPTQHQRRRDDGDGDEEDEEEEVEIIQVGSRTVTPGSNGSSSRKSRRLTILEDSDDEHPPPPRESVTPVRLDFTNPQRSRASTGSALQITTTPTPTTRDANRRASVDSGRRSSRRIEQMREEKARMGLGGARKLEYLSLDNCLDHLDEPRRKGGRTAAADLDTEYIDDDDEEEESEEEEEEVVDRRARVRPPRREERRERVHADGGEDLDDFIVGDDEVQYMDEDEVGVMDDGGSSAEDDDVGGPDTDVQDIRASMQSREPSEWFAIYLRYLEECILDEDFDNKMRRSRHNPDYQLFRQAIHHIERGICSRRDTLRSSVVWNDDIMESLRCATIFHSRRCDPISDCEACRRHNHVASQAASFGGIACDATELYKENWIKRLRRAVRELEPIRSRFLLGSVCHARTLGYWQLLHAKHFWVALVDEKRREASDGYGRIREDEREDFYKREFGRYKRLIGLVDRFSVDTNNKSFYMPNVWKKVTAVHVDSQFLPRFANGNDTVSGGPRRGTMDSVVAESEDEDEEEEEEEEEEEDDNAEEEMDTTNNNRSPFAAKETANQEEEEEKQETQSTVNSSFWNPRGDPDSAPAPSTSKAKPRRMWQTNIRSSLGNATAARTDSPHVVDVKDESHDQSDSEPEHQDLKPTKPLIDADVADILCLLCRENPRDGGVVHGHYLHFYCCYRCAKRQVAAKMGCRVCDRPIDRVLRILPLSAAARADILKEHQP